METKHTKTKSKGKIKYSYTDKNGVKRYDARIESIIYDHSPRNPSLPLIVGYYGENNMPTCKYSLTKEEALIHIKSFGFDGEIIFE